MEEGDLVGIRDLVKAKLFDSKGTHVGHLQDLAIKRDLSSGPTSNGPTASATSSWSGGPRTSWC